MELTARTPVTSGLAQPRLTLVALRPYLKILRIFCPRPVEQRAKGKRDKDNDTVFYAQIIAVTLLLNFSITLERDSHTYGVCHSFAISTINHYFSVWRGAIQSEPREWSATG